MNLELYIFIATYIIAVIYALVNVLKSRVSAVELPPEALFRRVKHSATLLGLFGRILKVSIVNLTTLLILASIVATSLMAAMAYGETRTELVSEVGEAVPGHLVLVKLSDHVSKHVVESALRPLIVGGETPVTYLYRTSLERGLRIEGVPEIKWVVIGVDGPLARKLNIKPNILITGCVRHGELPRNISSLNLKIECADPSIQKLKITPLETLLPILGYIGTEPITPSLDMVLISDLETIVKILNLDDVPVTDILIENLSLNRDVVGAIMEALSVDVIYYFHASTVLMIGSAKIITVNAMISTLFTIFSCAFLVTIAYRSLIPEFRTINEKLRYVGLPHWGIVATLALHMLVSALLSMVVSATLAYITLSAKQVTITVVVCLLSIAVAAITLIREVKTGTLSYGAYTPAPDKYEIVLPVQKAGSLTRLIEVIKKAIKTNEFFEIENISDKLWDREAVIYFRVAYKEMWGISLNGLIGIVPVNSMIRLFIEVSVSSVEEISEKIYDSIRALFVSKLAGKMKVCLELESC